MLCFIVNASRLNAFLFSALEGMQIEDRFVELYLFLMHASFCHLITKRHNHSHRFFEGFDMMGMCLIFSRKFVF